MSLSARAKAVRGVGYSRLLWAVQGLAETLLYVPPPAPPPSYGGPWSNARAHTRAPTQPAHPPRRSRRRRELDILFLGQP